MHVTQHWCDLDKRDMMLMLCYDMCVPVLALFWDTCDTTLLLCCVSIHVTQGYTMCKFMWHDADTVVLNMWSSIDTEFRYM